ncbi:hypothetical protein DW657_07570 [Prevotella sp. AM23-5]|nr:family 16 glycosylhydrolase [Prevotella sp. AM23-5]RHN96148.1 hypothetical protein DW657_07570 [Prevotella sp. AM23-5]
MPFTHFTDRDAQWADKFHVWRMDWNEQSIRLYLDDELLNEIGSTATTQSTHLVFWKQKKMLSRYEMGAFFRCE